MLGPGCACIGVNAAPAPKPVAANGMGMTISRGRLLCDGGGGPGVAVPRLLGIVPACVPVPVVVLGKRSERERMAEVDEVPDVNVPVTDVPDTVPEDNEVAVVCTPVV